MAEFQAREYHPAFEEYCETIWELHEDDVEVIQARIAERLEVSRPAVSEMIHRMADEGLVEIDRHIRLTAKGDRNWGDRVHFFRAAALAMRRILVDRARQKASLKGGGIRTEIDPAMLEFNEETPDDRILLIDESLRRLEKEDPDSARIVLLKFFAGLTNNEVAASHGVNVRTVERQWAYARACLIQIIQQIEAEADAGGA